LFLFKYSLPLCLEKIFEIQKVANECVFKPFLSNFIIFFFIFTFPHHWWVLEMFVNDTKINNTNRRDFLLSKCLLDIMTFGKEEDENKKGLFSSLMCTLEYISHQTILRNLSHLWFKQFFLYRQTCAHTYHYLNFDPHHIDDDNVLLLKIMTHIFMEYGLGNFKLWINFLNFLLLSSLGILQGMLKRNQRNNKCWLHSLSFLSNFHNFLPFFNDDGKFSTIFNFRTLGVLADFCIQQCEM